MWNGQLRCDGFYVAPLDTENQWVICAPQGTILCRDCPCCGLPLTSQDIAKKVADRYLPTSPEAA